MSNTKRTSGLRGMNMYVDEIAWREMMDHAHRLQIKGPGGVVSGSAALRQAMADWNRKARRMKSRVPSEA